MNNLFTHEKTFQTNFFLEFKNSHTENRFRQDQHSRSVHALIGYLVLSIVIVTFQFMDSTCFRYSVNCKLEWLTIFTLIAAITSLVLIHRKQDLHIIRLLLLIISLYHHLSILDRFEYTAALVLIVIQTTVSTLLVFDCWKFHVIYNTISYFFLYWGVNYWDMRQVFRKEGNEVAQDFAVFHLLSTIGIAFFERSAREKWVLLDSVSRTERVFQKLFEDAPQPSIILDGRKGILLSNRKGLDLISKIDKRFAPLDLSKTTAAPSLDLLRRLDFVSLIDPDFQELVNAAFEGLNSDTKTCVRVAFKKPQDFSNTSKLEKTITYKSLTGSPKSKNWEEYGPFYDLEISYFIWRGQRSYLLTLQDTTTQLRNHDILIRRLNKVVNELEESLFSLEKDYKAMTTQLKKSDNEAVLQPVAAVIMKLNNLKNSILNTHALNSYITGYGKQQFAPAEYNLKHFTVYLLETFSVQTLLNKIQVSLRFDNGFPEFVSSNPSLFQQVFGNVIKNIVENSRDVSIDIACGIRNIIAGGIMLLEFKIESEKTEFFNVTNMKNSVNFLMNETAEGLYSKLLSAPDLGIDLGLLPTILKENEGGVEVSENNTADGVKVAVTLIIPMPHYLPEGSNDLERLSETISKLHLTNVRSDVNQNKFIWKKEVIVEPKQSAKHEDTEPLSSRSRSNSSLTTQPSARSINSNKTEKTPRDYSADATSSASKSEKPLTYAEFQEKKKQMYEKSPMPQKRSEDLKVAGTRNQLLGLINPKNQLSKIQEKIPETEDSSAPADFNNDISDLKLSLLGPFRNRNDSARHETLDFSRVNSTISQSYPMDYASPESFKMVSSFNAPTFDEQLIKTIITFSLIELLSKHPPPSKKKKKELDVPSSDNEDLSKSPFELSPSSGMKMSEFDSKLSENKLYGADNYKFSPEELYTFVIHRLNLALRNENYAKALRDFVKNMGSTYKARLTASLTGLKFSLKTTSLEEILSAPYNFSAIGINDSARQSPRLGPRKAAGRRIDLAKIKDLGDIDELEESAKKKDLLNPSNRHPFANLRAIPALNKPLSMSKPAAIEEQKEAPNTKPMIKEQSVSKKNASWQKTLLPFEVEDKVIPPSLKNRTKTREKKWVGIIVAETDAAASKKLYHYNEMFTLLAVDDSPFQLKQLTDELPKSCQYDITIEGAKNGIEAYKRFEVLLEEGVLFHMILMDLEMPFWDGFEATTAIRQLESDLQAPRTYICGLSANTDEKYRRRCLEIGMDNFYPKPLTAQKLNELVRIKLESIKQA